MCAPATDGYLDLKTLIRQHKGQIASAQIPCYLFGIRDAIGRRACCPGATFLSVVVCGICGTLLSSVEVLRAAESLRRVFHLFGLFFCIQQQCFGVTNLNSD